MSHVEIDDIYALAPMQHGLLFQHLVHADPGLYVTQFTCRLTGPLDAGAFERAWRRTIARHACLRSSFVWEEIPTPVQVVHARIEVPMRRLDWTDRSDAEQERSLQGLLRDERRAGLDPGRAPLLRLTLIRSRPGVHRLVWTYHHVLIDGWSSSRILRDVFVFYAAEAGGREPELVEPRPYRDYVKWVQQQDAEGAEAFWRRELGGFSGSALLGRERGAAGALGEALDAAGGEPDGTTRDTTGYGVLQRRLSEDAMAALRETTRRDHVTMSTLIHGAWGLLLSRYTGEADVVFGSVASNRPPELYGADSMVGVLINNLPVRVSVTGETPARAWLRHLQSRLVEGRRHGHRCLSDIRRWSGLPPGEPLIRSILTYENYPMGIWLEHPDPEANLHVDDVQFHEQTDYPLTLHAVPTPSLMLQLSFDRSRFDAEEPARMLRHLETLLLNLAGDSAQPVRSIDLVPPGDRRGAGARPAAGPAATSGSCLHTLFEMQAERTPHRAAVTFGEETLTYGALDRRANRLAAKIRDLGVRPDDRVGLFVERSPAAVIGILGILKAGGAYVPLDPSLPAERIAFVLEDACINVLVTDEAPSRALLDHDATVVRIDDAYVHGEDGAAAGAHLASRAETGHLAYVIYTSGSSGRPKGVLVSHHNAVRLFAATQPMFELGPDDVWTLFHSFAFDFSVWELWGALLHGGRVVIVPHWVSRSPRAFLDLVRRERVTMLSQTPSAFRLFMQADATSGDDRPYDLRFVVLGGEALAFSTLGPWFERHGDSYPRIVNMYGITETTVHVTYREVRQDDLERSEESRIGGPLADLDVHILDEHMMPVAVGVPGEVYVGGGGVARGYLNRRQRTAECFVPDPFTGVPGARLYRTGDLARILPDGDVAFLGRRDQQVQLRGFRVEPGEVEAALREHPAVQDGAVVAREDDGGKLRLVAFAVPDAKRAHAVRRLIALDEGANVLPANASRFELPNGMEIVHVNRSETAFMYREIFEDACYLRHGISLPEDACVFDVGANVGLFTLYVAERAPRATIHAFEPIPPLAQILRINASLCQADVRVHAVGLSDAVRRDTFTYYPHVSIMSGRFADAAQERAAVKAFLSEEHADAGLEARSELLDDVLDERLASQRFTCAMTTLSDVIDEHGIDRIDLLKIDVEKSELDVLRGIRDRDWPKIQQIVLEVHDLDGRLGAVHALLEGWGFDVAIGQEASLRRTGLHNMHAIRPARRAAAAAGRPARERPAYRSVDGFRGELRRFLALKLPEYMVPSRFELLEKLPLTPNGKLDRRRLAEAPRRPEFSSRTCTAPRTPKERAMVRVWRDVLKEDRIGIHDSFFELGGDSILVIQAIARLNEAGLRLSPRQFFELRTVEALAGAAETKEAPGASAEDAAPAAGPVPFTPIQHWFFELDVPDSNHWNQSVLLEVARDVSPSDIERAMGLLLEHHDALRLRFVRAPEGWRQEQSESAAAPPLTRVDVASLAVAEREAAMASAAADAQRSLDITSGPTFRAVLFEGGLSTPGALLLVAHHLSIDGVSWRILLEDLETACRQLRAGQPVRLPPKTTSFKRWAKLLDEHGRSGLSTDEAGVWLSMLEGPEHPLPVDRPADRAQNTEAATRTVSLSLDADETQALLKDVSASYHAGMLEVLLAALAATLTRWTGRPSVLIDLEGHGREPLFEDVDVSRTIGWFTTLFPIRLDVDPLAGSGERLLAVKERVRQIPARGIGFGLLRYLSRDSDLRERLRALPLAEVGFNYLGHLETDPPSSSFFRWMPKRLGPRHDPGGQCPHLLEIEAHVSGRRLHTEWTYAGALFEHDTIERLARGLAAVLRSFVDEVRRRPAERFSPSDFPLSDLRQDELDALLARCGPVEDMYPLTLSQQGMLFHALYAPDSTVYFNQFSWTFHGDLDAEAFRRAWECVVARHPVLRTSFAVEGLRNPMQIVHRSASLSWEEHDWRGLSAGEREARLHEHLRAERRRGFDPTAAPPVRWSLIRLDETTAHFVWNHHHILLDGWCTGLILNDVFAFFEVFCSGRAAPVLPDAVPYRNYVAWLEKQDLAAAERFWREKLRGYTTPTPLPPADERQEATRDEEPYSVVARSLSATETDVVRTFTRRHEITLNTLVLGAWMMLMSRTAGCDDVVVGNTVSGRPGDLEGVERIVGLFISTLPVRATIGSDRPALAWLKRLQEELVEIRRFPQVGLPQIRRWSELPPKVRLFESAVVTENLPSVGPSPAGRPDLKVTNVRSFVRNDFPLTLRAVPGEQLALHVLYDTARFSRQWCGELLERLSVLMLSISRRPKALPGELHEETDPHEQWDPPRGNGFGRPRDADVSFPGPDRGES